MRRELRTVDPDNGGGGYVAFYNGTGTFTGAAVEVFAALRDEIGADELAEQLVDEGWSNGYIYLGPAQHDASRSLTPTEEDEVSRADDAEPTLDEIFAMAEEDDEDDVERAAGKDTKPGNDQLHHFWTVDPEGRGRWVNSPKPWTTLVAQLTEHVGLRKAKIFASRWFIEVFGYAAGSDKHRVASGKPPRGDKVGPG